MARSTPVGGRIPRQPKRRRGALVWALAVLVAGLGRPGSASAQASRAAQLFDAGVAELKLERYEAACAALEQSHELEENLGTLIALGDCLERWGKLHSAALRFEQLIAAVARANPAASAYRAPQLDYARAAVERLSPSIPRLTLGFPASFDREASLLLDGRALEAAPPEQEVRLDPGRHVLETRAAGREPWRLELELAAGDRRRVQLELGREHEPPGASTGRAAAAPASAPQPEHPAPAAGDRAEGDQFWRTLGWGLGGLGVAGVGVGAVAGVLLLKECPGFECSSRERARDLALVTDIGFGVGVAALAASALLLLSTDAPAASSEDGADEVAWRPLGGFDARGGWLGVSHSF